MQYNKREFQKISDKKILRKVKKTWVVVSMSSFFLLGSAYLSNHVLVSADTVSSTNEKEHVDDRDTSSTKAVFIQNVVDKDANAGNTATGSSNAADTNAVKATTGSSNATDSNAGNTATGSSNAADANVVKATTGSSNATDSNAGNTATGSSNAANANAGNTATGSSNAADANVVKATTGSSNATDSNAGNTATGSSNAADANVVKATTGSSNATDSNAGNTATGSSNATDSNAGNTATGSSNATDSNAGNTATGSSNATDSNAGNTATGSSNAADANAVKATTGSSNYADVNGLKGANGNNSLINNDDPNKGPIQGNPSTFLKHFILSGGATYDANSGTVTLTQDKSNQVGSFTLNSKINVHQDFNFSGQAYLGNKTDIYGGADGIGVAFQPNNVGAIGDYGANLGIGGLKNAVGFKLDTYYNRYESTDDWRQSNGNDSSVLGWEQDPTNNPNVQPLMGSGTPFGSFVTTDNNGWLSADKNSVQYLDTNKVLNTSATLLPFSIDFSSANNTMTVKFGNQVWTRGNIFTNPNDSMALSVSASTGFFHNLQQVTFNHFSFGEAASVNVEYVDDSGHSIATDHAVTYPDGGYKNKEYDTTQLSIPGYTFEKMGDNSLPAKGILNNWGNNGSVIYVYKNITDNITPNNPGYPGKPIHPDDPNSPKWPSGSDIDSLQKNVRETINYVDESGKSVHTAATQNITFTRNASVDEATGKVSYGGWNQNSASFSNEASPVVNGYVLKDHSQVMITGTKVTPESSDVNVDVVYTKLGSLVPTDSQGNVIDGGQYNTQYPNNQNNPSAINNPVLPEIPGKTPIDGQGHTLQPGNPYPVSSTDLSKNTTVVYVDSNQTAKVSYVDQTTGTTLEDKELTGLPNSTSAYRTADTIKKYTDAGYELVKDNYPAAGVQFGHDNQEQDYEVTLKHVEVPVSPEHSGQPGQAINPDNPNGPKWPAGTDVNSLQKNVRETINYVDESGKSVHTAATQNITFTRNASVDEVTGKVSYGGWNQNSASFSNEASPVVNGYVLKDHSQVMITGTKVTPESSDVNVDVVYTKLGSLVPTDSQGNVIDGGQYNTQYPNNQNNPSAINNPVLPEIPGKTPIDGQGHTLQPGNPYPVSSTDLSKNTTVVYVDSNQTAKVSYVDQTTGTTLEDKELTGLPNSTSAYRTADTIKKYTDAGYELVKDNYPAAGVQFGHDNQEQDYEVTLKHVEVPVSPEHSGQPGQAINPDNPNGPKWPAGTDVNSLQKNVRETINYVDESGKSVHTAATQNITFTRNASVDEATGKVSYGGWNQNSASFSNEASPVVNGYVLKDHSQVMITGTKVTPESSDVNVDVVYTKLGSLVPTDSQGNVIDGGQYNTQYPNNQNNPSAINNPVLPEIPGKTPIDGQGHTLQPGNPYPVSSTDLSKNTTVVYVDSNQTAKVSYVDQTTGTTLEDKELTGLPNSTSAYRTADTIKKYTDAGYELVKDNYPAAGVQFGHDNQEQDYEVTLKHVEVPVSPEHSGQPGQAINPDNPNGPKWPAGTDVNSLQKNVRETINYVDESGKSVHTAATQNITFTRNASVDEVTGKVSYGGWNQNSASFSNEASPVVNGYVLKDHSQVMITGTKVTPESSDVNVDVVYTKLGSLVPTDSQGNVIDGGQYNTQYPNNQNNPSAINNPVLPEIPGKTPIDGQGHTLQPGNPYPVSSTDLSKNTTVVYVDSNQNKDGSSSMQNTNTINRQDKLPQTGQSNSENINTFGALFTIIGTLMAGFNILRKRKNK